MLAPTERDRTTACLLPRSLDQRCSGQPGLVTRGSAVLCLGRMAFRDQFDDVGRFAYPDSPFSFRVEERPAPIRPSDSPEECPPPIRQFPIRGMSPSDSHFRLLGRAGLRYPQGCAERFPSSSLIPLSQAYPDAMTPRSTRLSDDRLAPPDLVSCGLAFSG
jgi:hypothetical protein